MQESTTINYAPETAFIRRRQLLPWWIKFFCWVFMIMGFTAILCFVMGILRFHPDMAIYGFESNDVFSFVGQLVIATLLLKGFTAYALWYEKDYAISLGIIDSFVGIFLCIVSMFLVPILDSNTSFTIRGELLLLVPFWMKLSAINKSWNSKFDAERSNESN
jgi:magnesium-transporting ATPase (P-type)